MLLWHSEMWIFLKISKSQDSTTIHSRVWARQSKHNYQDISPNKCLSLWTFKICVKQISRGEKVFTHNFRALEMCSNISREGKQVLNSACCMWPQEKQVCYTPRPAPCFRASATGRTRNTVQKHKLLQARSQLCAKPTQDFAGASQPFLMRGCERVTTQPQTGTTGQISTLHLPTAMQSSCVYLEEKTHINVGQRGMHQNLSNNVQS